MSKLPVLEAISFGEQLILGGRTKPWVVNVLENGKPAWYVVKLYTREENNRANKVLNEIIGSVLADEFDLERPQPALIHFSHQFIASIPSNFQSELSLKDSRLKFGCKLIEGSKIYTHSLHSHVLDRFGTEAVYAFDNLLQNTDRNNGKPNLLIKGPSYNLIDHEFCLNISNDCINHFEQNNWLYPYRNHIFYSRLKKRARQSKEDLFETFLTYLSSFNPDKLDSYVAQVQQCKYSIAEYDKIKNYLHFMKANRNKFVILLRSLLQ